VLDEVLLGDNFSEAIQCHSGGPQGSPLGPLFFILDININKELDLFQNVSVLGYSGEYIGDCQLFQKDLDRLDECVAAI
jgi:hypothetical protein